MESQDEESTQCTQPTDSSQLDPRRMGRNNSGLSDEDVGDVVVVLHPTTPAAFDLIVQTARRTPQHVLQKVYTPARDNTTESTTLDEQQTFLLENERPAQGLDLAWRFSSTLVKPNLGFTFGRNPAMCDIPVTTDAHKRVSNLHFVIYVNESGVVMLRDLSTNGTMVDDFLLKQKSDNRTRMLVQGTTIQILSPVPGEALKFVVRIPVRQGHGCVEDYERNFEKYMERHAEAKEQHDRENGIDPGSPKPAQGRHGNSIKAPLVHNTFGMHWNGGDVYNVVGHVGKGAFASVYQLATKIDGQLFAAKELEKRRFMKNGILDRKLENEMHIMQSIDHKSVVQYHEYKDIANHLYIIMEFVPCGDLQQHLNQYGALRERTAKQMALQVLEALDYLHIKNITHRDIKPDNILIASRDPDNFIIKLSDFGLSKVVKDNDTFLKTFCGTLLYCAPEVFPHYDTHVGKGNKRPRKPPPQQAKFHSYSQAVDIWSFGAVLWYSLCVKPPFEGVADNTGRGMFDKIMMTPLNPMDLAEEEVSDEAVTLLVSMLNTDPKSRPSPADCLRSSWFADEEPVILSQQLAFEMGPIAEEVEGDRETAGEPDVGGLSLDEHPSSQYSEVSLNDSDLNFFDPRQSKRFKGNDYVGEEDGDLLDSSPELFESIPIMHDSSQQSPAQPPRAPKLFGEISQSDLQSPAFGRRVNDAVGQQVSSSEEWLDEHSSQTHSQHAQPNFGDGSDLSPSLFGAEAMVRGMNMESAFPSNSEDGANSGQNTPKTPPSFDSLCKSDVSHESVPGNANQTPRPAQRVAFDRRINIGIPASFFYVPDDPSTHNIEYASRVSGHDFAADPVMRREDISLPLAISRSSSAGAQNSVSNSGTKDLAAEHIVRPRSRTIFGRLISTPDSFTKITIELDRRINHWGRNLTNTHSYHDKQDTRIPKIAFAIFFHASGIDAVSKEEDIRHLPGLYSGISTYARSGLKINGVQLDPMDPATGQGTWGVLQTGDEIEVCSFAKASKGRLKFRVEIYYGEGKKKRSKNGPKFTIEHAGDDEQDAQGENAGSEVQAGAGAEDDDEDLYS